MNRILMPACLCTLSVASAQLPQFAPIPLPGFPSQLANDFVAGDFDGDGDLDLVSVTPLGPVALENVGGGVLVDASAGLPALQNQRTAAFVDIDNNGVRELLLTWTGGARLFQRQGGVWIDRSANLPSGIATIHGAAAVDIDGDGDEDLACAGSWLDFGQNQLLRNDGTGVFTLETVFLGYSFQVIARDVDADGDLDLLFARSGLQLWLNDGLGTFTNVTASQMPPLAPSTTYVVAGDVNGDGATDVFVGGSDIFLTNDGTGHFAATAALGPAPGSTSNSALVDVDCDGDLDVWRGNLNFPTPSLFLNDGLAGFTSASQRLPQLSAFASQCAAADVDGDGDPDLLLGGLAVVPSVLWNRHRQVVIPQPPSIGTSWDVEVWSEPNYGTSVRVGLLVLAGLLLSTPVDLPPLGLLRLDVAGPVEAFTVVFLPGDGPQTVTIPVPAQPAYVGLPLHVQALIIDGADGRFTNAASTTIQ
ncbi:MAG: VCBS repeat-containing protein [Planctomycetes bacterium]|nr:VCBS repeat-containing protein [Planctomycetota bacterium]